MRCSARRIVDLARSGVALLALVAGCSLDSSGTGGPAIAKDAGTAEEGGSVGCGSLAECDGACVDLATDASHCGECFNACQTGACVDGGCVDSPAGPCGHLADCDGTCIDTDTDAENCGECFNACQTGACVDGGCVDSPGGPCGALTDCSGACTDTDTDTKNCGECGNACLGSCVGGSCF